MLEEMIGLRMRPSIELTEKVLEACDTQNEPQHYLAAIRCIRDAGMEVSDQRYHDVLKLCKEVTCQK
jgi:hypothetical protein